jgi:hypothetical protein
VSDDLALYARWMAGEDHNGLTKHDSLTIDYENYADPATEARIRDVAKRVECRRAQLDDGISKLIVDLTADSDTLLQTVQHSATSAAVYAATLNVIQRLHDTLTAKGLE